jgi:hypothetical protein
MTLTQDKDFALRKMSIDVIFTLAKMHPTQLKPFKNDVVSLLTELKFDKMKAVREIAFETLGVMKDVPDTEVQEVI